MEQAERAGHPHPHHRTIPQYHWPYINGYEEARAIDRAYNSGIEMFVPQAPVVLTGKRQNGESYLYVTSTGYAAVWPQEYRAADRLIFHVGRDKQWRGDYKAACCAIVTQLQEKLDAEENPHKRIILAREIEMAMPRETVYQVDIEKGSCFDRETKEPCPAWEGTGRRWCKHALGMAHRLTRPYRIAPSGLILRVR